MGGFLLIFNLHLEKRSENTQRVQYDAFEKYQLHMLDGAPSPTSLDGINGAGGRYGEVGAARMCLGASRRPRRMTHHAIKVAKRNVRIDTKNVSHKKCANLNGKEKTQHSKYSNSSKIEKDN